MTTPIKPELSDADFYDHYRDKGLSHAQAVMHVERRRAITKAGIPEPPGGPGPIDAAIHGVGQGATSGWADEYLAALMAASGRYSPPASGAAPNQAGYLGDIRQEIEAARGSQPLASAVGNIAGAVVNPVNRILGPLTQGLGPASTGAVYGATLGGLQGVGEGPEGQRMVTGGMGAVLGGTVGLLLGYGGGKVSKPLGQMWRNLRGAFARNKAAIHRALPPTAAPEIVQAAEETAHRTYLTEQGYPPEVVDRLMQTWRAGGKLPPNPVVVNPPVETTVSARPGETLVQTGPKSFEVHGARATPPVPTQPTILEMQEGRIGQPAIPGRPDLGTTVPAGPRQKAGSRVRTQSPKPPSTLTQEQTDILLAMSPEEFKAAKGLIGNKAWNAVAKLRRKK